MKEYDKPQRSQSKFNSLCSPNNELCDFTGILRGSRDRACPCPKTLFLSNGQPLTEPYGKGCPYKFSFL
ncbi:MAG: hypothetical protein U9R01_03920, partial [candidate division WOR-3 bacterium]|nr:hypothetical protein [candidate division WOR-3 bacterium]